MTGEDDVVEPGEGEVPESSSTSESEKEPGVDELPETPEADASTEKKQCWVVRACKFIWAHRTYYLLVVLAMAVAYILGYIFARKWGAQQWGPVSEWVAGLLTLGAVVLALREAMRSQIEREIDLELERRRECIRAVADVWTGVTKARALGLDLSIFLTSTDFSTNQNRLLIDDERLKFSVALNDVYQPPRFYANIILHETPLIVPLAELHERIIEIIEEYGTQFAIARTGRRPSSERIDEIWTAITRARVSQLELARLTFSLDRRTVRSQLRGRRT